MPHGGSGSDSTQTIAQEAAFAAEDTTETMVWVESDPEPPWGTSTPTWNDPYLDAENYISNTFDSLIGVTPQMGWYINPGRFFTTESHPSIFILSSDTMISAASWVDSISSAARDTIARTHHVACDGTSPLAEYRSVFLPDFPSRAFWVPQELQGAQRFGSYQPTMTDGAVDIGRRLLGEHTQSVTYADTTFQSERGEPFYSAHAVYDSLSNDLIHTALVLRNAGGELIAAKLFGPENYGCDGCAVPWRTDGFKALYSVLNAFHVPGFVYPLLMMDISTLEGRGISLVTFDSDGVYHELFKTEYVVTCITEGIY